MEERLVSVLGWGSPRAGLQGWFSLHPPHPEAGAELGFCSVALLRG